MDCSNDAKRSNAYDQETIVATATPQGCAARGVLRLSGENAIDVILPFFAARNLDDDFYDDSTIVDPQPSFPVDRPFIENGWFSPWKSERPDLRVKCALFYWPQGRGFTGERAVELHLPGSPAVLQAATRAILETGRARMARRGEFTLRAFLNGRVDLVQAEAILGAIDAETDAALGVALKQLSGATSRDFEELRDLLLDALSEMEAGFDFVDEDVEFITPTQLRENVAAIRARTAQALQRARGRTAHNRAPRVALIGAPNVGKSSLFNRLTETFGLGAQTEAIVSEIAGTTRDYLEAQLEVDGFRFDLVDSAGVETLDARASRELAPSGEETLSARARAQLALRKVVEEADLTLCCWDGAETRRAPELACAIGDAADTLEVATKCDACNRDVEFMNGAIATSAATRMGIEALGRAIVERLQQSSPPCEATPSTALRCQEALVGALDALDSALALMDSNANDDFLIAAELRAALEEIGLVTGRTHTDDLLDRIFSRFCIGK